MNKNAHREVPSETTSGRPQEIPELLRRILAAVEPAQGRPSFELLVASKVNHTVGRAEHGLPLTVETQQVEVTD